MAFFSFVGAKAFARNENVAPVRAHYLCSRLLQSVEAVNSLDQLLARIDELEFLYSALEQDFPSADLSWLKGRTNEIIDQTLSAVEAEPVKLEIESLIQKVLALFPRETQPDPSAKALADIDYLLDHNLPVEAEIAYTTAVPHLSVVFNANVVEELRKDFPPDTFVSFLKAIQKGFVGPHDGDGIERRTHVHQKFLQLKFVGGNVYRLLGCLDGKIMRLKKVYMKRNEGRSGALRGYGHLCD